ncbi:vomeronasal type-1 receptor 48-like [Saimiri boliviensis]|uniref:vomeronasal type-1 receptor 48-like n=1 Tax=Saimiri boliviensis TaxID=27679 RepID=UPI00193D2D64|nr:putative vomeronasal receptor-like protein 4 [Saimiri boliviensis boliviensis]
MLSFKSIFCFQASIGISANSFLLLWHIFSFFKDHRPKKHDLIICHLAFVHIVMLLIAAELLSPDMFESLKLQNNFRCKPSFYIYKVMRGLSVCITSFLSMLQAITISPITSWLVRFKHKITKYNILGLFFFWFLNLSFNSDMIIYMVGISNVTQIILNISKYCSLAPMNVIIRGLFVTLSLSRDVFFVGITLLSSAYMVSFLSRHQRRSQHLHSNSFLLRTSPEKRATETILLLASFFVVAYSLDFIVSSSTMLLWVYSPIIYDVNKLMFNAYATVSPMVLIRSDRRIINILPKVHWKCHPFFKS